MVKPLALTNRALSLAAAALLLVAIAVPALVSQQANAAQVSNRYVDLETSVVSATDVVYTVGFDIETAGVVQGVVVDFCSDSPLIGETCTAPTGFATNAATTLALASATGVDAGFAIDTTNSTANTIIITNNTASTSLTQGTSVVLTFGSDSSDGLTNPSTLGTFYARILTYSTEAAAQGYGATTPGSNVDEGGAAMSTADQLTVTARVQEQLEFCVAAIETTTTTAAQETDCSSGEFATPQTEVDLGVIDSNAASASPVSTNGGNDLTGAMIVRTNAANGATVSYFAELDGTGTEHLGALRVPGATCIAGVSNVDQCFNSDNTTGVNLASAGEGFGTRVNGIADTASAAGGTTGNLTATAPFNGANFVWDDSGAAQQIASSSNVLDYTILELQFGARSAATTPTGTYTVNSTYIATATY